MKAYDAWHNGNAIPCRRGNSVVIDCPDVESAVAVHDHIVNSFYDDDGFIEDAGLSAEVDDDCVAILDTDRRVLAKIGPVEARAFAARLMKLADETAPLITKKEPTR